MKKTKFYSILFPLWAFFLFPIIFLFIIPGNFILDSLVLMIAFFLCKVTFKKENYQKIILKVWVIGFLANLIGAALLILPQFFGSIPFVYEHLIYPLVWNPFMDFYAFFYCTLAVALSSFFLYHWNCKYSFEKTDFDQKRKRKLAFCIAILSAPYLFYLPTSLFYPQPSYQNQVLEDHRGSYVGDNTAIGLILTNIDSGKLYDHLTLKTENRPYRIVIEYKDMSIPNFYKTMEQDSGILFNLIQNVDEIEYLYQEKSYLFAYEQFNLLYKNQLRKIKVEDIQKRYASEPFTTSAIYLGNIMGTYDLFDESLLCGDEKKLLYEDPYTVYYLSCNEITSLVLYQKNGQKILLKEAIAQKLFPIEEVLKTNLKIIKEAKK